MRTLRSARLFPVVALAIVTMLWGSTFFLAKDLVARSDPMALLAVRFALAAAVMALLRPRALLAAPRSVWVSGTVLGLFYGVAQIPQYYGLQYTSATMSGFVIGSYVVFTPLLAFLILRQRSSPLALGAVGLAIVGLAVLTLDGLSIGRGEALSLIAAVLYACQIIALGRWSQPGQSWALATVQMIVITVVVTVPLGWRGVDLSTSAFDLWGILYLSLVASVLAIGVQTWAQSRIPATHAAVIMSAEPLWAAVFAVSLTAETLTGRMLAGGALLMVANLVVSTSREARTVQVQAHERAAAAIPAP